MCIDLVMDSELIEVKRVPAKNVENDLTQLFKRNFSRNPKVPGPVRKDIPLTNREVGESVQDVLDSQRVREYCRTQNRSQVRSLSSRD